MNYIYDQDKSKINKDNQTLYQVLEINQDASNLEIRKAYRKLALKYHPDKLIGMTNSIDQSNLTNQSNPTNPTNPDKFIQIQYAYEVLSNEDLKRKYDSSLNPKFNPGPISGVDGFDGLGVFGGFDNSDSTARFDFRTNTQDIFKKLLEKIKKDFIFTYLKKITTDKNYFDLINVIEKKILNNELKIEKLSVLEIINTIKGILDINYTIDYSIEELYNNTPKKISYNRITKEPFEEYIYPIDQTQNYEREGETINISGKRLEGNFNIKINLKEKIHNGIEYFTIKNDLYGKINTDNIKIEYDSEQDKKINYLVIDFLDGEHYQINFEELDKQVLDIGIQFKIPKMGINYYNTDNEIIDLNSGVEILRGNLYFILLI